MSDIRAVSSVRGSLFSIEALQLLSSDSCNVLFVSDRTMHLLKNISQEEPNFLSRYASTFEKAGKYHPIDASVPDEVTLALDVARNFKLEMTDMSCDINQALLGIQEAILTAGSNACACGTVGEGLETTPGTIGGPPPDGFGDPDPAVSDRICKAANAIHESILATVTALEASPVEAFIALGFGVVSGLVSGMIATAFLPVVGLLLTGVAGAVIGVTLAVLVAGVDMTSLKAALISEEDDLICALATAVAAQAAIDAYITVLGDAGQSVLNQALIRAMMTLNVVNLLWFSTPDSEAFLDTYSPPNDCSTCGDVCGWDFAGGGLLGTGDLTADNSQRTLSSVPNLGIHTCQIQIEPPTPVSGCGLVNRIYEVVSVSGWTNVAFASNDAHCRDENEDYIELWNNATVGDPPPGGEFTAGRLRMSSDTAFTAEVILKETTFGPCS